MNNICFVIMPYGIKPDSDGKKINFDLVYQSMIKKAVEDVPGLECVRCDDIEKPGWVHQRMLTHILEDRVAVVDTSMLNANVFYELGVRHALCRATTVLIHQTGTTWPFNIAGMSSIKYKATPKGIEEAKAKIRTFIVNGMNDPNSIDSLVYSAIPELRVRREPTRISKVASYLFPLVGRPGKRVGFVTGDREDITVGDVWATSENTNMQMDSYYGKSTSATIRYLGAKKDEKGKVLEDTIGRELAAKMGSDTEVPAAAVLVTGAGSLARNKVKRIFHIASVKGEPREGYRPIPRLDQCVKNALRRVSEPEFANEELRSILLPIFGTGPGSGDLALHAKHCLDAAIDHLETMATSIDDVYFYVWSDIDLEICLSLATNDPRLEKLRT